MCGCIAAECCSCGRIHDVLFEMVSLLSMKSTNLMAGDVQLWIWNALPDPLRKVRIGAV
jgi:hypothetical protein